MEGTKEVRRDEELIFKDFAIATSRSKHSIYIYTCTRLYSETQVGGKGLRLHEGTHSVLLQNSHTCNLM